MNGAYAYVIDAGGITLNDYYPYISQQNHCRQPAPPYVARIGAYNIVTPFREDLLQLAVSLGPVGVGVQSSSEAFQFYYSGVLNDARCGNAPDHAVLLVGYGVDVHFGPYWLAKNQWGPQWGEQGFVRIARGINMCGIAQSATFPLAVRPFGV